MAEKQGRPSFPTDLAEAVRRAARKRVKSAAELSKKIQSRFGVCKSSSMRTVQRFMEGEDKSLGLVEAMVAALDLPALCLGGPYTQSSGLDGLINAPPAKPAIADLLTDPERRLLELARGTGRTWELAEIVGRFAQLPQQQREALIAMLRPQ
jgi:hypothetical protein